VPLTDFSVCQLKFYLCSSVNSDNRNSLWTRFFNFVNSRYLRYSVLHHRIYSWSDNHFHLMTKPRENVSTWRHIFFFKLYTYKFCFRSINLRYSLFYLIRYKRYNEQSCFDAVLLIRLIWWKFKLELKL